MLGSSVRSFKPNCKRKSFEVPYIIGRPTVSLRPLATINFLSSSVLIEDGDCTPRISRISGTVTGCLYAMTARVSSEAIESFPLGRILNHVGCCLIRFFGFGNRRLRCNHGLEFTAGLFVKRGLIASCFGLFISALFVHMLID